VGLARSRPQSAALYLSPALQLLGTVNPDQQEEVLASFRLHNGTRDTVRITNTLTSCSCTELKVGKYELAPKDSSELTMRVRTKGLRGHHKITAHLWTDNPEYPRFELVANGDFTPSAS